jgi:hypothetical protein
MKNDTHISVIQPKMGRGEEYCQKVYKSNYVWMFPVLRFEKMRLHRDAIRGSIGINGNEEEIAMSAAMLCLSVKAKLLCGIIIACTQQR